MAASNTASEALLAALRCSRETAANAGRERAAFLDLASRAKGSQLVELAAIHRVAALLHDELAAIENLGAEPLRRLTEARRLGRARNLRVARTAHDLAPILDSATGGRWVILKGPALAPWYEGRARTYVDLDLLVHRSNFRSVMQALEDAGQPSLTANWAGFLDHGVGEVPLGDFHMVIDLHWHPIALQNQRRQFSWDVNAMIDRRVEFDAMGTSLPTLDPVDSLLHLCSHTGLAGARRLVWTSDIDIVARSASIDWEEFLVRARKYRIATLCATVLDRNQRILNTPMPVGLVDELCAVPGWTGLNRAAGRRRSDKRARSGWSTGFLLTCGRDSLPGTIRALTAGAAAELRKRAGRPGLAADGGDIDWHRVDDGADPVADKQAWLDYVASERA